MKAILVECSDCNIIYGILSVKNISAKEVQKKIYEIKNKFYNKGFNDWTIDDVLNELPDDWEWDFDSNSNISVLEI